MEPTSLAGGVISVLHIIFGVAYASNKMRRMNNLTKRVFATFSVR